MQLTLFVNHACNLRCRYCYTGRKLDRPMPLDIAQKAIDFGLNEADAKKAVLQLAFFGGEPLLEPQLMKAAVLYAQRQCEARGFSLVPSVATNGTLLDKQRLEMLRELDFRVQVSLDGNAIAQNATRPYRNGRGSYARVAANLQTLQQEGFAPRIVSVVDPQNVAQLADSFDALMALGLRHIQLSPNYMGDWNDAACDLFEAQLEAVGNRYMDWMRAGNDVRFDPLQGKIVTHLATGYKSHETCKFGRQELAVSPSGKLYPCDRLVGEDHGKVAIGDIFSGIDVARRDQMISRKNKPDCECERCELRPRCMHWCGCANYETTGDVGQTSPMVCYFERCFIAEADRIGNTLYAERNPVFLRRFYAPDLSLEQLSTLQKVDEPSFSLRSRRT
jgi:uncharacterized protein